MATALVDFDEAFDSSEEQQAKNPPSAQASPVATSPKIIPFDDAFKQPAAQKSSPKLVGFDDAFSQAKVGPTSFDNDEDLRVAQQKENAPGSAQPPVNPLADTLATARANLAMQGGPIPGASPSLAKTTGLPTTEPPGMLERALASGGAASQGMAQASQGAGNVLPDIGDAPRLFSHAAGAIAERATRPDASVTQVHTPHGNVSVPLPPDQAKRAVAAQNAAEGEYAPILQLPQPEKTPVHSMREFIARDEAERKLAETTPTSPDKLQERSATQIFAKETAEDLTRLGVEAVPWMLGGEALGAGIKSLQLTPLAGRVIQVLTGVGYTLPQIKPAWNAIAASYDAGNRFGWTSPEFVQSTKPLGTTVGMAALGVLSVLHGAATGIKEALTPAFDEAYRTADPEVYAAAAKRAMNEKTAADRVKVFRAAWDEMGGPEIKITPTEAAKEVGRQVGKAFGIEPKTPPAPPEPLPTEQQIGPQAAAPPTTASAAEGRPAPPPAPPNPASEATSKPPSPGAPASPVTFDPNQEAAIAKGVQKGDLPMIVYPQGGKSAPVPPKGTQSLWVEGYGTVLYNPRAINREEVLTRFENGTWYQAVHPSQRVGFKPPAPPDQNAGQPSQAAPPTPAVQPTVAGQNVPVVTPPAAAQAAPPIPATPPPVTAQTPATRQSYNDAVAKAEQGYETGVKALTAQYNAAGKTNAALQELNKAKQSLFEQKNAAVKQAESSLAAPQQPVAPPAATSAQQAAPQAPQQPPVAPTTAVRDKRANVQESLSPEAPPVQAAATSQAIQEGGGVNPRPWEDGKMLLFEDPQTKSTLSIPMATPPEQVAGAVRDKIAASRKMYEDAEAKAASPNAPTNGPVGDYKYLGPVAPKLPAALAGAKPRYAYGDKQFELHFSSDVDKAAYIAAQAKPSKQDVAYVKFAASALGAPEPGKGQVPIAVRLHGEAVKASIKQLAKGAKPGTLQVPELAHATPPTKVTKTPLDQFEAAGREPWHITRQEWTDLQRAHRRAIGQDETSGTANAPYSDYEEYHKQAVKEALAKGEAVPQRVLADYPELQKGGTLQVGDRITRSTGSKFRVESAQEGSGLVLVRESDGERISAHTYEGKALLKGAKVEKADAKPAEPEAPHKFSSTQVNIPEKDAAEITDLGKQLIPDKDIAPEHGREEQPHVTVKFGLHGNDPEEVRKIIENEPPIKLTLGKIKVFKGVENGTADAVVVDVDSPDLHRINKAIADALPTTDTHPEYKPHLTLAYVKPGLGQKYEGDDSLEGRELTLDSVVFSGKDRVEAPIQLKGGREIENFLKPGWSRSGNLSEAIAKTARELEMPTDDAFAEALWRWSNRPREVALGIAERTMREAGYEPFKGFPLQRLGGKAATTEPESGTLPVEAENNEPASQPESREPIAGPNVLGAENPQALEGVSPEDVGGVGKERATSPERAASAEPDQRRSGSNGERGEGAIRTGVGVDQGDVGVPASGEQPGGARVRAADITAPDTSHDYRITDADQLGEGTSRVKLRNNLEAIRTLKQILKDGREATPAEKSTLVKYSGWGAIPQIFDSYNREFAGARVDLEQLLTPEEIEAARRSTTNAHYTSPEVIKGMWAAAQHLGIKPESTVLEPSMGIGHFFGLQPNELMPARRAGVELDTTTGQIAKLLYPDSNVQVSGFERTSLPNNFFDIAVGNVPFGNFGVHDPAYKRTPMVTRSIHDYFFAKALDKVRPGGVVAFVTSSFSMDKNDPAMRKYLADRANLLGAIRLPGGSQGAFAKNAGTEVTTDIIFLQKRQPQTPATGEAWASLAPVAGLDSNGKPAEIMVNEYYTRHPEMMLGQMAMAGTMYGPEKSKVLLGEMTPEKLAAAVVSLPKGVVPDWSHEAGSEKKPIYELPDAGDIKNGAYAVHNGKVVIRDGESYVNANLSAKDAVRVKDLIGVRDSLRSVFRSQIADQSDADVAKEQKNLGRVYDNFVKKHGPVSKPENMRAYSGDPDAPLIRSLENYDPETGKATKADVFTKRTIARYVAPEKADSSSDALAIALTETGRIEWSRMQELTGRTPEEMQAELGGLIYHDPEGHKWTTADEYLSGNVRAKLRAAESALTTDGRYAPNVEALRAVQPRDLMPGEITIRLGSPWIPKQTVQQFVSELLGVSTRDVNIGHAEAVGSWSVEVPHWVRGNVQSSSTWGTQEYTAPFLIEDAMNLRTPKVYRQIDKDHRELDPQATAAAQEKQQLIRDEFAKWALAEDNRAKALAALYNEQYNSLRLREYDGHHLTFPGMAKMGLRGGDLDRHQKDAIWRQIQGGNTLLAHVVGAGKTFEMIAAGMEMKRMGLVRKPLYAVPNHLVTQWGNDFLRLYPAANILVVGKEDFAKGKRQTAMSRIATGNWDAVIVAHSSFGKIPVSDELFKSFVGEQVDELRDAAEQARAEGNKRTVKELEKQASRLEKKIEDRAKRETKDSTVTFEELGVDHLFVDEAHCFPYETGVLTDKGILSIGQIVEKKLSVKVLSRKSDGGMEWKSVVNWFTNRQSAPVVRIVHQSGKLECTANHSVWTERGYVEAGQLRVQDVLMVRKDVCAPIIGTCEQRQAKIVQQPVRRELAECPAGQERKIPILDFSALGMQKGKEVAGIIQENEGAQSYETTGGSREDEAFPARENVSVSWRERTAHQAPVGSSEFIESPDGTRDTYCASTAPFPEPSTVLQSGPSARSQQDCNRSGWENPSAKEVEILGPSKDGDFSRSRVVSVAVHEREGDVEPGMRSGRDQTVYCLQVQDNNNFFADGVLVSNSFKNLPYATKMTRVAGLPNSQSDRAMDMFIKTQYLSKMNGGHRGVVFATGTPISNTLAEMYTMQRYLQLPYLKDTGTASFDSWVQNYAESQTGLEMAPEGGRYRMNTRFSKFVNLPELLTAFRSVADVKNAKDLNLPKPEIAGGKPQFVSSPQTQALASFVESLGKRAEIVRRGQVDPSVDNMLKITSEGRKAALDMRLIDPSMSDNPDSKVNLAARNIANTWKATSPTKSTQLVFLDMGTPRGQREGAKDESAEVEPSDPTGTLDTSIYEDLREKLVAAGIPRNQVAFIHDYPTDADKRRLFDKVNRGDIRVLIGSTEKMGAGMNVQRKLIAMHHLDVPWRPGDLEQRNGRGLRQGNENPEVAIHNYVTEGSFDAFMWSLIESKAKMIEQAMSGDLSSREMEDTGLMVLTAGEAMAIASGDPAVREKIQVDAELTKLDRLDAAHKNEQFILRQRVADLPRQIASQSSTLEKLKADQEKRDAFKGDDIVFPGKAKVENDDLLKRVLRVPDGTEEQIGLYKGFPLVVKNYGPKTESTMTTKGIISITKPNIQLMAQGELPYSAKVNVESPAGTVFSLRYAVKEGMNREISEISDTVAKAKKNLSAAQLETGKPFTKEARLQELRARKEELDKQLDSSGKQEAQALENTVAEGELPGEESSQTAVQKNIQAASSDVPKDSEGYIEAQNLGKSRQSGEAGFASRDLVTLPFQLAHNLNNFYDRWADATAQALKIGRRFPEVEGISPEIAAALRLYKIAPSYCKEVFRNLYEKYWATLGPEREKIAMMMSDAEDGAWLKENHPDLYREGEQDADIQLALEKLQPLQKMVFESRQVMGGVVGEDEQHMRRTYPERVAGLGDAKVRALKKKADELHGEMLEAQADPSLSDEDRKEASDRFKNANNIATEAAKKLTSGGSQMPAYDKRITRQGVNNKGRVLSSQEYWERGTKELGPSFGPDFIGTMTKLAEHNVATKFIDEATLLERGEELPLSIRYNGKRYFHPDWIQAIKRTGENGTREQRDALAAELDIPELPPPSQVQSYGWSPPNKPSSSGAMESAVLSLPDEEITPEQIKELKGKAFGNLARQKAAARLYLGPRTITEAMDDEAPDSVGGLMAATRRFASGQIVGFGLGIPHLGNEIRASVITMPGGMVNLLNWPKAFGIAFDKRLRERGVMGVDDPTINMLLRHGATSAEPVEIYRSFLKGMGDLAYWKQLMEDRGKAVATLQALSLLVRAPLEVTVKAAKVGHDFLYGSEGKPGVTLSFRIEQADRAIKDRADSLGISEDEAREWYGPEIADEVNGAHGKANRAAWTEQEKKFGAWGPTFPMWLYRSLRTLLKHPMNAVVGTWVINRMINEALYRAGYIHNEKDRNDLRGLHFGNRVFVPTILAEPLAQLIATPARMAIESMEKTGQLSSAWAQRKAIGEAVHAALPTIGKIVTNELQPIISGSLELGFNQLRPGGREIIKKRDIVPDPLPAIKKVATFAAQKAFPGYARMFDETSGKMDVPEAVGGSLGLPNYPKKR